MEMTERILLEKGIGKKDNGAVLIDFKKQAQRS
jgi:hypothetical protein